MPLKSQDRIKSAAIALFADKGYAATATREICDRAGVTKPVLYYHFNSKEDLHRVLVFEACSGLLRELTEAASRGTTVAERLTNVLAADFALTKRNPRLSGMIFRMLFSHHKEAPGIDLVKTGEQWRDVLVRVLKDGVRRGEIVCRPRDLATSLLGVDVIYSLSYVLRGEPDLNRRLAARIVKQMLGGCSRTVTAR